MNDRDRLIELIDKACVPHATHSSSGKLVLKYIARAVDEDHVKPLVDLLIANGVTVQKHGRWVMKDTAYACGECGVCFVAPASYCYGCGAKMDLEENHD